MLLLTTCKGKWHFFTAPQKESPKSNLRISAKGLRISETKDCLWYHHDEKRPKGNYAKVSWGIKKGHSSSRCTASSRRIFRDGSAYILGIDGSCHHQADWIPRFKQVSIRFMWIKKSVNATCKVIYCMNVRMSRNDTTRFSVHINHFFGFNYCLAPLTLKKILTRCFLKTKLYLK